MSFSRSSFFIHAGLLAFLPSVPFFGMHRSWAWRRWFLNINQFSWTPLPFRALCHGTILSRSLKRPKSAFLKSKVLSLLCTFLNALRILSCTISWSLQPRLPLSFTFPASPSFLVRTRSSIRPLFLHSSVTWRYQRRRWSFKWRLKWRLKCRSCCQVVCDYCRTEKKTWQAFLSTVLNQENLNPHVAVMKGEVL